MSEALSDANTALALDTNPPPAPPKAASPKTGVPAKKFTNIPVTITPVLTPDKLPSLQPQYLTTMKKLISSAKKSLFIQLQYIEASKKAGEYDALLQTIADRVAAGVDVRLVESLEFGEKWAEMMVDTGVNLTANIRLQSNVHNKGFVVDSSTVVVSSQNFSPAGVQDNRDAGVVIENETSRSISSPSFSRTGTS